MNLRPYAISNHEPCQIGNKAALSGAWDVPFVNFRGARFSLWLMPVIIKNGFTTFFIDILTF